MLGVFSQVVGRSVPALLVLAAGSSTRYGRLKQLDPLGPGGEALLDYAVFDADQVGCSSAVLVIQEAKRREFEAHLAPAVATGLPLRLANQPIDPPGAPQGLPSGQSLRSGRGRTKPWGTGFAVLAAREYLDAPFVVCNADDFYGREAFAAVVGVLRGMSASDCAAVPLPAVTVGYRLAVTLSESGGVSRGICEIGPDGTLRALTEGLNLRRVGNGVRSRVHGRVHDHTQGRIQGHDPAGAPLDVSPDALVCTSLWSYHPGILDLLAERFQAFLAEGPGPEQEFYLTEAVHDLIAAGKVRCTVLPTDATWLGVTFPGDRDGVADALRKLVESGVYPEHLWAAPKSSLG